MDWKCLKAEDDPDWDIEYAERRREYDRWLHRTDEEINQPRPTDFLVDGLIIGQSVTVLARPPFASKLSPLLYGLPDLGPEGGAPESLAIASSIIESQAIIRSVKKSYVSRACASANG